MAISNQVDSMLQEIVRRVRSLEEENARLREELRIDHLTGIFNMLAFKERVEESRYPGYYVFADGDGMGRLNKHPDYGHDRVNGYIKEFGNWLRTETRAIRDGYTGEERRVRPVMADAIAVRKHGDEFLVWCSSRRGAVRIRNAIRRWRSADGVVTFSSGMGKCIKSADANCTAWKERVRKCGNSF